MFAIRVDAFITLVHIFVTIGVYLRVMWAVNRSAKRVDGAKRGGAATMAATLWSPSLDAGDLGGVNPLFRRQGDRRAPYPRLSLHSVLSLLGEALSVPSECPQPAPHKQRLSCCCIRIFLGIERSPTRASERSAAQRAVSSGGARRWVSRWR